MHLTLLLLLANIHIWKTVVVHQSCVRLTYTVDLQSTCNPIFDSFVPAVIYLNWTLIQHPHHHFTPAYASTNTSPHP